MSMKKTVLASAIALTLVGGQVATAATSTTGAQFILDKTEVNAGGTINLALLGLDSNGAVDRFGEASGSVIMAVVSTVKGKINGGSATPGATPTDTNPAAGSFASDVKYVRLVQGNGAVNITYAPDVSGSDTVEIFLQERIPAAGGGIEVKQIGQRVTKQVTVNSNSTSPVALDIAEFKAAPADAAGMSDADSANGIMGKMTAGIEGSQIVVKAANSNAAGNVTVALMSGSETAYSYSANMLQGQAIATLDSKVVKAGSYYVKATFEGFEGDSVHLVHPDKLTVSPTGVPRSLKISSNKIRITESVGQGAHITIQLLDEYGNSTSNRNGDEVLLKLKDANEVVSNTALDVHIPQNSATGAAVAKSSDVVLGNADKEVLKLGTTSLVVSAVDSNNAPVSTIAASEPLAVKTVADTLAATLHSDFSGVQLAGTEFNAFTVTVTDGKGAAKTTSPGTLTIKNMKNGESVDVNRDSATNVVQLLMTKATDGNTYLISDDVENGNLAQVVITAHGIKTAAATKVEVQNAHKEVVTSIAPTFNNATKTYTTTLPEVSIKMFDSFSNAVTGSPITEAITGTFTLTSANGEVNYSAGTKGVPGSTGEAKVTYDADGAKKFAGKDTIAANFTKPGLGSNSLNIETTIPALQELTSIKSHIESAEIPVNSKVALTVEVLNQDGKIFKDDADKNTVVKVTFNGVEGDTLAPSVTELSGLTVSTGQSLNFGTEGRKVFVVDAGSVKGQFSLSFVDADGKVTPEVRTFTVTDAVEECSTGTLGGCATEETCADKGGSFVKGPNDTDVCKGVPAPGQGGSAGTDKDGNPVTTGAKFGGGASVDDSDFLADKDVNKGKFALIAGNIEVDPAHVGLAADLVVIALHKVTLDGVDHETLYALNDTIREDGNHNFGLWQTDENPGKPGAPADLTAFSSVTALEARHSIQMWNAGLVDQISTFEIQFGYRITEAGDANEGLIVINSTPLKVNIVE